MERLLLVYNPNSSQYIHVEKEVLSRLIRAKGRLLGKFAIKKAPFNANVKALKQVLADGDTVIAVGGDATAAVAANAILESGKDVTMGVLPYGNFNDLSRTLGTMEYGDIFNADPHHIRLYPLDILVDGKHWRYATCYVTMGMTAEAVELFDAPAFRKSLQKGRKSSWRSYLALVKWYFKFRHSKIFIPPYSLNGNPVKPGVSDYCALSGRSMCRVMKGGDDFLKPKVFRSHNCRLLSFWGISTLMLKSILFRTPGIETTGDEIVFNNPATIELQAEGEYQVFRNVKRIEVKKPDASIKMIYKE